MERSKSRKAGERALRYTALIKGKAHIFLIKGRGHNSLIKRPDRRGFPESALGFAGTLLPVPRPRLGDRTKASGGSAGRLPRVRPPLRPSPPPRLRPGW